MRMNNTTKNIKTICLLVCLLGCMPVCADRIMVEHRYFGADRMEDIDAIGKWLFVDDRLQLVDHEGYLLGEEYMENIVKITFSVTAPIPTSSDEAQSGAMIVYPNPTQEMLCVQGAPADATLRVYSTAGQLVATAQGTQIMVGNLPAGTYLLQVGTHVMRFVKE